MPETIHLQSGDVHYYYSSDQRKLMSQKQTAQGLKTHRYFDEFEMRNDTLYAIQTPIGRISPKGDDYTLQYFLKNHLGNIVVTFEDSNGDGEIEENGGQSEVLQRNVYYPFGMEISHPALEDLSETTQDLKYNGKESQEDFNLNYLDYHARQYDAVIGRFVGVDPLADEMPAWSPYSYTFSNPIRFTDPDGRKPEDFIIWYKDAEGANRTFRFNGTNGSTAPNNVFVQNVIKAYNYNVGNGGGCAMQSAVLDNTIDLEIIESVGGSKTHQLYDGGIKGVKREVIWRNTSEGLEVENGDVLSPATILEHESDHAVERIINYEEFSKNLGGSKGVYSNSEEFRVIKGNETYTAKQNGKISSSKLQSRYSHNSNKLKDVKVPDVTSNKSIDN